MLGSAISTRVSGLDLSRQAFPGLTSGQGVHGCLTWKLWDRRANVGEVYVYCRRILGERGFLHRGPFSWSLEDPEVFVLPPINEAFTSLNDAGVEGNRYMRCLLLFRGTEGIMDAFL